MTLLIPITSSGLLKLKSRHSANVLHPWISRKAAKHLWKNAKPILKANKISKIVLKMQAFYTCFLKFCLALNSYIFFLLVLTDYFIRHFIQMVIALCYFLLKESKQYCGDDCSYYEGNKIHYCISNNREYEDSTMWCHQCTSKQH